MKGIILTQEQKDILWGQSIDNVSFYNPIQDINGNWFISVEEQEQTTKPEYLWIKDLLITEIELKPVTSLFS